MLATQLRITGSPEANASNAEEPLASLIGVVLNQQVPAHTIARH